MQATKTFFIVLTIVVVASLGYAFYLTGSPFEAKKEQKDQLRASDVTRISSEVISSAIKSKKIPATLDQVPELDGLNLTHNLSEYTYTKTSESNFEICTTFLTDSKEKYNTKYNAPYNQYSPLTESNNPNVHTKGLNCFDYEWHIIPTPDSDTPQRMPATFN